MLWHACVIMAHQRVSTQRMADQQLVLDDLAERFTAHVLQRAQGCSFWSSAAGSHNVSLDIAWAGNFSTLADDPSLDDSSPSDDSSLDDSPPSDNSPPYQAPLGALPQDDSSADSSADESSADIRPGPTGELAAVQGLDQVGRGTKGHCMLRPVDLRFIWQMMHHSCSASSSR